MYSKTIRNFPLLILLIGLMDAPIILAATETYSSGSPRGWVKWYDMVANGSTVAGGQDLGNVQAKSDYDVWGHASCGRNAKITIQASGCYLTSSDSSTKDEDSGGCGDATTNNVNVLMRPSNYFTSGAGTAADIPNCIVKGEWNGGSNSRTYYHGSTFEWISSLSGSYPIGYGNQSADARVRTNDSNAANRVDVAYLGNTTMRFSSDTPTICTVKEWGEIIGLEAGKCIYRATSDVVGVFASKTSTQEIWWHWPDTDSDGILDNADNCIDDANPGQEDTDNSGIGDACNTSRDGDGDEYELSNDNCVNVANPGQEDTDGNGVGDACNDGLDSDGDEWENRNDNCPSVFNPSQAPSLTIPGLGDACDTDSDSDGVLDGNDNCPTDPNADQADSNSDGIGDVCAVDSDTDSIDDQLDNCPNDANVNQSDYDNDGYGDVCEQDSDNDGVADDSGLELDNCPLIANPDQADADNNRIGDACEMVFVMPISQGDANCLAWEHACSDIQTAINVADASDRRQVFVAAGTYRPASTINLASGVSVLGGFSGDELRSTASDPVNNLTVISGDPGGDLLTDGIVETVADKSGNNNLTRLLSANNLGTADADQVNLSGLMFNAAGRSTALDGAVVWISNSYVRLLSSSLVANESASGAILATAGAKVEVLGVKARNNEATNGAVVAAIGASTQLEVKNSNFTANTASANGGVVYLNAATAVISKVEMSENVAAFGGAIGVVNNSTNLTINSSELFSNSASSKGGAINITSSNEVNIGGVEFTDNNALNGAAVAFAGSTTKLLINASSFIRNFAQTNGGAVHGSVSNSVDIINSTFAYNRTGVNDDGGNLAKVYAQGGALNFGLLQVPVAVVHSTFVGNESFGSTYGGGAIAIDNTSTDSVTLFANLIIGNLASSGNNLLVVNAGAATGIQKIIDSGYNMLGFNGDAGVEPAASADVNATTSFIASATAIDQVVETQPNKKGGDGYWPEIRMLPIVGGGEARDVIPSANCNAVAIDARGELRPDEKESVCDVGAYEYTVLSCQEDATRRYAQGETFVKSCASNLENFELNLGFISYFCFVFLSITWILRRRVCQA